MQYSLEFIVDPANKLLICEASGEICEIVDFEHLFKTIVKMAGKNQVKNIVLDVTEFKILCGNAEIAKLLVIIEESGLLGELKIARIVKHDMKNVIEGLAEKLSLSIKDFDSRSKAMLWLLFDKES